MRRLTIACQRLVAQGERYRRAVSQLPRVLVSNLRVASISRSWLHLTGVQEIFDRQRDLPVSSLRHEFQRKLLYRWNQIINAAVSTVP